jgi:phage shock protein PspC (stress-responsive transcriptional regulator)
MKKTLTVNISGIVFHIDEDAYDKLNRYLNSIRKHFSSDDGCDEIIAGIESRIAEMFQEKVNEYKQVVTLREVEEVIGQLGEPEQISGEEEHHEKEPKSDYYQEKASKRLYRDPDDKYIGGVCGGLGAFFQIDPTWVRIIFLIGIFAGFGILLYLILWIVIPRARTTAEKLEMRGERVNLSNIEKSIKEDLQDIKNNLKDISEETRDAFKKKKLNTIQHNPLQSFILAIVSIFGFIFRIVAAIAGVVVILLGIVLLTALITALFVGPVGIHSPVDAWLFSLPHFLDVIFSSHWMIYMATIAIILSIGIPLMLLIFAGLKLIFNFDVTVKYFGVFVFFLWITGLALSLFVSINAAREFTAQRSITEEFVIAISQDEQLFIDLCTTTYDLTPIADNHHHIMGLWDTRRLEETGLIQGIPRLRIRKHNDTDIKLIITKESRGATYYVASQNTAGINYSFLQNDSTLCLDPYFSFSSDDGWRVQKVFIELLVPNHLDFETSIDLKKWLL